MKKTLASASCLATVFLSLAAFGDVSFPSVVVRQQWPFSPRVTIDYTLSGATEPVDVTVEAYQGDTLLGEIQPRFLSGDTEVSDITEAAHSISFLPAHVSFLTNVNMIADFRVKLSAHTIASRQYMIVDLSGGPSAASYPVTYTNEMSAEVLAGDTCRTTQLWFRRVTKPGTFWMGKNGGSALRQYYHSVTLTHGFYVAVFEVTQKQYALITGLWPSYFTNTEYRDTRPAEKLCWLTLRGTKLGDEWPSNSLVDADSVIGKMQARTGLSGFDLPTSAQWEYAARAGVTTDYCNGLTATNGYVDERLNTIARYLYNGGALYNTLKQWDATGNYARDVTTTAGTARVGSFLPNNYGLYDVEGNVSEFVLDWHYEGAVSNAAVNPPGVLYADRNTGGPGQTNNLRNLRGGSFENGAALCTLSWLDRNIESANISLGGMRPIVNLGPYLKKDE